MATECSPVRRVMGRACIVSARSGWLLLLLLLLLPLVLDTSAAAIPAASPAPSASTNTWVVLVSTSRYWFNYRHTANALSVYRIVKAAGVPDSNILLLLPDDYACQPRNGPHAAAMFNSASHAFNLYQDDDVEVDYRGSAVTVEALLRLLTGRHSTHTAKRQRLLSDERSNVLLYMSGHGGNEFLKFQDAEELSSTDIGLALRTMHAQRRFSRLLMVSDTCQAESLHKHIDAPGVLSLAASRVGENSYSSGLDPAVGLSLIDRFTDGMLDFFEQRQSRHLAQHNRSGGGSSQHWMSRVSVGELVSALDPGRLLSHPVSRTDLFPLPLSRTPLNAFFAADHRPHASSSQRDTYAALAVAAVDGELGERRAESHPSSPPATPSAAGPSSPPPSLLRATLPGVSSTALRRQLRSFEWSTAHRPPTAVMWTAVAASACLAALLLCWLLERSNTVPHSQRTSKTRVDQRASLAG